MNSWGNQILGNPAVKRLGIDNRFLRGTFPKSANFTSVIADKGKVFDITTGSSTITVNLPLATASGDGWYVLLRKADVSVGLIASSPAENPSGTLALMDGGDMALVWSNGSVYDCDIFPASINLQSSLPTIFAAVSLKI